MALNPCSKYETCAADGSTPKKRRLSDLDLELLHSGSFADIEIECQGLKWSAHRAVLAQRCDFFKACLRHPFAEKMQNKICLNDDEPYAVQAVLTYVYTLEYPSSVLHSLLRGTMGQGYMEEKAPRPVTAQNLLWCFDLKVFEIADKFGLIDLAKEAEERFIDDGIEISGEYAGFTSFFRGVYNLGQTAKMLSIREKVVRSYDRELAKALHEPLVVEMVNHIPDLAIDVMKTLVARIR